MGYGMVASLCIALSDCTLDHCGGVLTVQPLLLRYLIDWGPFSVGKPDRENTTSGR
jgi:hypothetical protein